MPRAPAKLPVAPEYGLPSKLGCNGPSLISIMLIPLALAASRSPMAGAAAIGPCGTRGHGSRPSPTARAAAGPAGTVRSRGGMLVLVRETPGVHPETVLVLIPGAPS